PAASGFFVGPIRRPQASSRFPYTPLFRSAAAKTALWAMEHATLMLACSQLGITVASLLILNVSEPSIHHLLAGPMERLGLPGGVTDVTSFVVALLLVSFLHVTFGEMVPKNLSFSRPDSSVLLLAPPLVFVGRLVSPIIRLLDGSANWILRRFGVEPRSEATSTFTLDQVATIVAESKRVGLLSDDSGTLTNAFEFTTKK